MAAPATNAEVAGYLKGVDEDDPRLVEISTAADPWLRARVETTVPDTELKLAFIQFVAYLYEAPDGIGGVDYADAFTNSGAQRTVFEWVKPRAQLQHETAAGEWIDQVTETIPTQVRDSAVFLLASYLQSGDTFEDALEDTQLYSLLKPWMTGGAGTIGAARKGAVSAWLDEVTDNLPAAVRAGAVEMLSQKAADTESDLGDLAEISGISRLIAPWMKVGAGTRGGSVKDAVTAFIANEVTSTPPAAILNEAVARMTEWLQDAPAASGWNQAFARSGAKSLLARYRTRRAVLIGDGALPAAGGSGIPAPAPGGEVVDITARRQAASNAAKLMPPSTQEATNASATAIRGWTARLIRTVVESIVPAWARRADPPQGTGGGGGGVTPSQSSTEQTYKSRAGSAYWEPANEVPDTPGTSSSIGHTLTVTGENDTDYAWRAPAGGASVDSAARQAAANNAANIAEVAGRAATNARNIVDVNTKADATRQGLAGLEDVLPDPPIPAAGDEAKNYNLHLPASGSAVTRATWVEAAAGGGSSGGTPASSDPVVLSNGSAGVRGTTTDGDLYFPIIMPENWQHFDVLYGYVEGYFTRGGLNGNSNAFVLHGKAIRNLFGDEIDNANAISRGVAARAIGAPSGEEFTTRVNEVVLVVRSTASASGQIAGISQSNNKNHVVLRAQFEGSASRSYRVFMWGQNFGGGGTSSGGAGVDEVARQAAARAQSLAEVADGKATTNAGELLTSDEITALVQARIDAIGEAAQPVEISPNYWVTNNNARTLFVKAPAGTVPSRATHIDLEIGGQTIRQAYTPLDVDYRFDIDAATARSVTQNASGQSAVRLIVRFQDRSGTPTTVLSRALLLRTVASAPSDAASVAADLATERAARQAGDSALDGRVTTLENAPAGGGLTFVDLPAANGAGSLVIGQGYRLGGSNVREIANWRYFVCFRAVSGTTYNSVRASIDSGSATRDDSWWGNYLVELPRHIRPVTSGGVTRIPWDAGPINLDIREYRTGSGASEFYMVDLVLDPTKILELVVGNDDSGGYDDVTIYRVDVADIFAGTPSTGLSSRSEGTTVTGVGTIVKRWHGETNTGGSAGAPSDSAVIVSRHSQHSTDSNKLLIGCHRKASNRFYGLKARLVDP